MGQREQLLQFVNSISAFSKFMKDSNYPIENQLEGLIAHVKDRMETTEQFAGAVRKIMNFTDPEKRTDFPPINRISSQHQAIGRASTPSSSALVPTSTVSKPPNEKSSHCQLTEFSNIMLEAPFTSDYIDQYVVYYSMWNLFKVHGRRAKIINKLIINLIFLVVIRMMQMGSVRIVFLTIQWQRHHHHIKILSSRLQYFHNPIQ